MLVTFEIPGTLISLEIGCWASQRLIFKLSNTDIESLDFTCQKPDLEIILHYKRNWGSVYDCFTVIGATIYKMNILLI